MIDIQAVAKRLGGKPILERIDLRLAKGAVHVLLGSSGSGKTTLLKLIAGALAVDDGQICVDGQVVRAADPCPLADILGYMTQEGGLFPHLTAAQNATLLARVRGWSRSAVDERLQALAELAGVEPALLDRYPAQLSGGQRQRVALMRALFLRPSYLLLDEPLAALDPISRRAVQTTLRQVFSTLQMTVVMVTHDVGEAAFFGDTVTLLYQGRMLQHGPFAELATQPQHPYVREFLLAQRPVPQLAVLAS